METEPSFEERLRQLAKVLQARLALNRDEYFALLPWATVFTFHERARDTWNNAIGIRIGDIEFALMFTRASEAAQVAAKLNNAAVSQVSAGELLGRLEDGWGVIIDFQMDTELRFQPDEVTEFSERYRLKVVRQEATDDWLAMLNSELASRGIPSDRRLAEAMAEWQAQNGFRVLSGSRRYRRIKRFFAINVDSKRGEMPSRCEALWRRDYLAEPYLATISGASVRERLAAIMANLLFADRESLPHELTRTEWLELFHQVRFEHERRDQDFLAILRATDITNTWPHMKRAQEIFARYAGPTAQLLRFSKLSYLREAVDGGKITIFQAAKYQNDASLQPSQKDNELERTVLVDARKVSLTRTSRSGQPEVLALTGALKLIQKAPTNYYVWCTTTRFDPRLFDDFKADACLVIHNAREFSARIHRAVQRAIPGGVGAERLVSYFDPLRSEGRILSTFQKDFKFEYQREFRFAWDPPSPVMGHLPPLEITLGSLRDIASLIALDP